MRNYSGNFVVENYLGTPITGYAQHLLEDSDVHSQICTFTDLPHNGRTSPIQFHTETGHGDFWSISFIAYNRLFVAIKKCDYKKEDAPQTLILRFVRDGDKFEFKVICPESSDCDMDLL